MSKRYDRELVLSGVELKVECGEVVGLIGPNGAGKTTVLECAIGIRRPTFGCARIMGFDTWTHHSEAAQHYSVQFQASELPPFSRVSDTFWLFRRLFATQKDPLDVCSELGIVGKKYHSYVGTLSGGEKRRIMIALAFLGDRKITLLDEPTSGMDPGSRSLFWDAVRRRRDAGKAILCSSHDLSDIDSNCDRVAFLIDGTIRTSGRVVDVIRQNGAFMTYVITLTGECQAANIKDQMSRISGVVWSGYVQSRMLVVSSKKLLEDVLQCALHHTKVRHWYVRRSNLEDIYHMYIGRSTTPGRPSL